MKLIDPDVNVMKQTHDLIDIIDKLPCASLSDFEADRTLVILVDIINGFIREGAMADGRIADIIPPNVKLLRAAKERGMRVVAATDCHESDAAEFQMFPAHCVVNTSESQVVKELTDEGGFEVIPKNSTNSLNALRLREIIEETGIRDFIITGDCTDICVMQLCLALKTYFTEQNINPRIVVPLDCVETYDAPYHYADFANLAAIMLMADSGVTIVKKIV